MMEQGGFAHLEVHSFYTLLGGISSPQSLAERAAADGLTHLAITDTNALYGVVTFDHACRAVGVQPIIGMAVSVARHSDMPDVIGEIPGRLVLLATGPAGYRSLCRISARIQARPDRDAVIARGLDMADLAPHGEGLICLSGGRLGLMERLVRAGEESFARSYATQLARIYGDDTFLSLELHQPADVLVAQRVEEIGHSLGVPCVAAQPVYCLTPEESSRLRLLAAIDRNCLISEVPDEGLPAMGDPEAAVHWLGPDEMVERFSHFPNALAMVGEVAGRCGSALPDGRPIWPSLPLPPDVTPADKLANLAAQGARTRYGPNPPPELDHRLGTELAVIDRQGYAPLFLIVADIVRFARDEVIPVSTRGSVANSLVAYCVGITDVDPLAHGLVFERFLNPARADAPDIDLDFCSRRRDRVLDYVRQAHGFEKVAMVGTISTLQPRSAVRETAKACGLDEGEITQLVAELPRWHHPDPRRRERRSVDEIAAGVGDKRLQEVLRLAFMVVGQPHHLSVHPGGIVITPGPLTDVVPIQWAPKGFLITQLDHKDVESIGLPKMDLLGVRALTVLADAAEIVRRWKKPLFHLEDIPMDDDPLTSDLLCRGDTIGVFQCESAGARKTLRKLRARNVRDLAVANAFFKPGPSTGGMAATFVRRYRGEEDVSFLHPALVPILGQTKGVLIFQEQILRIAREVAGLSWAQADHLRRGMSKFRSDEMSHMRQDFVGGCQRPAPDGPGLARKQAETLWSQVLAFAGYGFNQGHATAYAAVSYRLAYLKAHWPASFLCARLANGGGFHPQAIYIAEAIRLGIDVRPPHVNHSEDAFTLQAFPRRTLWMGLGQVRDLRQTSIDAIIMERQRGPFSSLHDLLMRVTLLPKEIDHLVQCGALDDLGKCRMAMLVEAQFVGRAGGPRQLALPFDEPVIPAEDEAQRLKWELHLLGQPVSVHPMQVAADRLPDHVPLSRLPDCVGQVVTVAGVKLPGRTGDGGFYLGDMKSFVIARGDRLLKMPQSWQPIIACGRWLTDAHDWGWFEIDKLSVLDY